MDLFHALSGSTFALDIVELNAFGNRANGVTPCAPEDDESCCHKVHRLCEAIALTVRDNVPETAPGRPDGNHSEDNQVIVKSDEAEILVAQGRSRQCVARGRTFFGLSVDGSCSREQRMKYSQPVSIANGERRLLLDGQQATYSSRRTP